MKWTDEEIDQMAREAAGKITVPYQDQFWNEMEALLPAKSKKKGFWWLFSLFFGLIGLATTLYFVVPQSNFNKPGNKMASSAGFALDSNDAQTADSKQSIEVEQLDSEDLAIEYANQTSAELTDASSTIKSAETAADNSNIQSKSTSNKERSTSNKQNLTQKVVNGNPNSNSGISTAKNVQETRNQGDRDQPNAKHNLSLAVSQAKNNATQPDQHFTERVGKDTTFSVESEVVKELNIPSKSAKETADETTGSPEESALASAAKDSLTVQTADENAVKIVAVAEEGVGQNQASDSDAKINNLKEIPAKLSNRSYYLLAGASFAQSPVQTTAKNLMSGVTVGVGYQNHKSNFGYSIGLHATSYFVNNLEIVRTSRVYGFGVVNYEQLLKYKQLTFIELPIQFRYIQSKNTFSVGIAPTYLASTMMNFRESQEASILSERNFYGQKVGLKSVGLNAMIGYQRAISTNWFVGIQAGTSLIPQLEKNHFEGEAVAFPFHGQITIRRTLIPKK